MGRLVKCETDELMLVDFNVRLCKPVVRSAAASTQVLTDLIVTINPDKCSPTSCSAFIDSVVMSYRHKIKQFLCLTVLHPHSSFPSELIKKML